MERNELIYIAGRLFRDEKQEGKKGGQQWVYEKWAKVTTS